MSRLRLGTVFRYTSGEVVRAGDFVRVDYATEGGVVISGTVTGIFAAHSVEADEYGCDDTGGILILLDNGEHQLWESADERVRFVKRD